MKLNRYSLKKMAFLSISLLITGFLYMFLTRPSPVNSNENRLENLDVLAAQTVEACSSTKPQDVCYTAAFKEITKNNDLDYTLNVLATIQEKERSGDGCHFIAHVIAGEEVKKDPAQWQNVIKKLPINECTGGFLMGVMEARQQYEKNIVFDEKYITEVCRLVLEQTEHTGSDQTCTHTMGHLLLVEKNGDVNQAVAICDKLPGMYQYECFAGIFMENLFRRNLIAHGLGKELSWNEQTRKEQTTLCNDYTDLQAQACWREVSHMFVSLAKNNPPQVFASCLAAPTEKMQDECYLHAVGVMILSSSFNDKNLNSLCGVYADTEKIQACIIMATDTLRGTSKKYDDEINKLCNQAKGKVREACAITN